MCQSIYKETNETTNLAIYGRIILELNLGKAVKMLNNYQLFQ
jgi:hypothetical protein